MVTHPWGRAAAAAGAAQACWAQTVSPAAQYSLPEREEAVTPAGWQATPAGCQEKHLSI